MSKTIGYIRVSTDKQEMNRQRHLLLEYAHKEKIQISEILEVQISATRSFEERRITELFEKLQPSDTLIVSDLSRLGRRMVECLQFVEKLNEKGVYLKCLSQLELDTSSLNGKLIVTLLGYVAECERINLSLRTKQGLNAAKASGKVLGRPKGCKNKKGMALDPFKEQILEYLKLSLPISSIRKIVNNQTVKPLSYNTYSDYISGLKVQTVKNLNK